MAAVAPGVQTTLVQLQGRAQGELLATAGAAVRFRQRRLQLLVLQQIFGIRETFPTLLAAVERQVGGLVAVSVLLCVGASDEAGQPGQGVCSERLLRPGGAPADSVHRYPLLGDTQNTVSSWKTFLQKTADTHRHPFLTHS